MDYQLFRAFRMFSVMLVKNYYQNVILCVIVASIQLKSTEQEDPGNRTTVVKNAKKNAKGYATLTYYTVNKLDTRLA